MVDIITVLGISFSVLVASMKVGLLASKASQGMISENDYEYGVKATATRKTVTIFELIFSSLGMSYHPLARMTDVCQRT